MSRVYEALKRLEAGREASQARPEPVDTVRLEQFLDLQRGLLLTTERGADLPDRLVHRVATFLGVAGAAIGVVQGASYRLLATYGAGYEDRARHDHASLADSELASALSAGRPLVLQHPLGEGALAREVVLPFRGEVTGALHLTMPEGATLGDEKVQLARLLAGLVGVALANARQSADPGS
jgi:GAF domain-containing protein